MSESARPIRVIVHAGFHKTGTTTVQRCLQINRAILAPHAQVLLRADLMGTSTAAGLYARWRLPPLRLWLRSRLRRALRRHPPVPDAAVVISCERLSGMMPGRHGRWRYDLAPELAVETVRALRAVWGPRLEIGFVYTTRDRDAWTESVWRHLVQHDGMRLPFERFGERLAGAPDLEDLVEEVRARILPVPVETVALENWEDAPLGPAEPILRLAGLWDEVLDELIPVPPANVGQSMDAARATIRGGATAGDDWP